MSPSLSFRSGMGVGAISVPYPVNRLAIDWSPGSSTYSECVWKYPSSGSVVVGVTGSLLAMARAPL